MKATCNKHRLGDTKINIDSEPLKILDRILCFDGSTEFYFVQDD